MVKYLCIAAGKQLLLLFAESILYFPLKKNTPLEKGNLKYLILCLAEQKWQELLLNNQLF